jgi:uncharacterized protein YbbK (DUF523 family)
MRYTSYWNGKASKYVIPQNDLQKDLKMDKLRIVISRCLGFDSCRYDGSIIRNEIAKQLPASVTVITVCPEVDIGMNVPRRPINLRKMGDDIRVIQTGTLKDYTHELSRYAEEFLDSIEEVNMFILKCNSPSCGIGSTKLFDSEGKSIIGYVDGVFTRIAVEKYPKALFMDEKILSDMGLEKFLTKII